MTTPKNPTEQLRPVFNELFKFQIGETVALQTTLERWRLENTVNPPLKSYDRLAAPPTLVIRERTLQECHGGIQMLYLCSGLETKDRGPSLTSFPEFDLASLEEVEAVLQTFRREESRK